jgi:hypothetical protein
MPIAMEGGDGTRRRWRQTQVQAQPIPTQGHAAAAAAAPQVAEADEAEAAPFLQALNPFFDFLTFLQNRCKKVRIWRHWIQLL